ncbi:MAG: hypothetical protein A2Y62_19060 [Candidatus Fischerbacteria bacterium RBG_13_37_8]|uniref:4Fe-4S ferredoxin-type domain-containing protein n=1 Tax=Candidatus Fischerbacteria bacterium RBG_13_37_8 TaxID=1817863 RepID=A0A1F5VRG3_9BACT|nr:MAG: hypothetical protein A2Y62_19060 [Candidatus Fischerbacteria bacterium RBG_13_37_8]
MKDYFKNIALSLWTIILGMKVTITYFFQKPTTVQYPKEKIGVADNYRGELFLNVNECTACLQCNRSCPINCITIEVEGKGKERMIRTFNIDMNTCMLCGLCERVCSTGGLKLSTKYEVAVSKKDDQILHFVEGEPIKANIEALKKK